MKCNKCQTPVVQGDKKCRFCGNELFYSHEIIDIEPEIIDIAPDIIDIEEPVIKGQNLKNKEEIDISDELEKTARLSKIDIEEFTGRIDAKEVLEIKERFKESKIEKKPEIKLVEEEIIKKPENEKKYSNLFVTIGVLTVLVVAFGISTGYLFLNRNVLKNVDTKKISTSLTEAFFDSYEIMIPDNWKTTDENNVSVFFDDTYEWGASLEVIENVDFDKLETVKEDVANTYSKNRYIFTSNYTKKINEEEFFIYKGKYDAYIVYLIMNKIDDKKVLITDLKFKGEVSKEILDTFLNQITEIKKNDLNELYETNFDFSKTGQIVKDKIVIEEEINQ